VNKLDDCFAFTMRWEGGDAYTNDPADPGGPTKYGVTLRTLRDFFGNYLLTAADVQALTEAQARTIYFEKYYRPMRGDDLPAPIALMAVDFAYNSGRHAATFAMQHVLGCETDGIMGPLTASAAKATPADSFVNAYGAARLTYLQSLPTWPTFGRGWNNRVLACMAAARKLI
jgi:lysozyme family protein